MNVKMIPIMLKDRQISKIEQGPAIITRTWQELGRAFRIKKIYHPYTPTERIVLELKGKND